MSVAWRIVVPVVVAAVLAGASLARAESAADDLFVKGLRERGLTSLLEVYLKQKPRVPAKEGTGKAPAAVAGDQAMLAALAADNAIKVTNVGEREMAFQKARQLYEEAIDAGVKSLAAIPASKQDDRNKARLQILKLRLELANLIYQKWLRNDLDMMEITDRRGGDRAHAVDLLKVSVTQYKAITAEAAAWLSEIDRLSPADRSKFVNTGYERELNKIQRQSKFNEASVMYYYGWVLPTDYTPQEKERSRKDILNDAITAFMEYTKPRYPDSVAEKWYAYITIAAAYRELGKFQEAVEALAQGERLAGAAFQAATKDANPSPAVAARAKAAQTILVRAVFERALTDIRKEDFTAARKTIDDARGKWKDKLDAELYGLALPVLEALSYTGEGQKNNDQSLVAKGTAILKQLNSRKNPWPQIVQWVMGVSAETAEDRPEDLDKLGTFELWLKATAILERADKTKDAKQCLRAIDLYKRYLAKVNASDEHYAEAMYSQAACLLQLSRDAEAAGLFQKVADEAPKYRYATQAAKYAVAARGGAYQRDATEENRAAYEATLKWFTSKWLKEDPEQQYFYAYILYRGKKLVEAADAFTRVAEGTEHYSDARYWVPLCHLEQFRDQIIPSRDAPLILSRARVVAQELTGFADFAAKAQVEEKKKTQLSDWALTAYINAADVYLYPEVQLADEALKVMDALEQRFSLDDEARGKVLKLRIDALQKLAKLDEAQQVLEKFLQVAKKEEVGPVLRGLFRAITDDVRELIKRGDKDSVALAARKVDQAKRLGDRLTKWLDENNIADKTVQIENNRYDLAELYLAVGNYIGALAIYQEIGGAKPWVVDKNKAIKADCVYGMARAYEGMGEQAADATQARQNFETALEVWRVLQTVAENEERIRDMQAVWDRRFHVYYCALRLALCKEGADRATGVKEVHDKLNTLRILNAPEALGGKDAVLQQRFRDLVTKVAAAVAGQAVQFTAPGATPPPAAPAAGPTAATAPAASAPAANRG